MPLSEHEQRLLEQMERALHAEDPKLASTLRHGSNRSVNGRQVFVGVLGLVIGLAGLLGGVITSLVVLGVIGFLVMLGGALLIGSAFRSTSESAPTDAANPPTTAKARQSSSHGFMDKMEERWRKRREQDGFQ